jgi:hypothetical protein
MKPRCASCKKPIPRSEPDLILRRMDPDDPMRTASVSSTTSAARAPLSSGQRQRRRFGT